MLASIFASYKYLILTSQCDIMKKLVVEVSSPANGQAIPMLEFFSRVERMETIMFLRQSAEEISLIFQITFKSPETKMNEFPIPERMSMQILDHDRDRARYTVLVRGTPDGDQNGTRSETPSDIYVTKFSFNDGTYRLSLISSPETIGKLIQTLKKIHGNYRVISLTEARFGSTSPTDSLTERQRSILTSAYRLGYYDVPRRINTEQLAEKEGIANSTLVSHLRKAEKRVMDEIIGGI